MRDLPLSVWLTGQAPSRQQCAGRYLPASTEHTARMLPEIARHAIHAYSALGDVVLDPLCGIGTTLVEAAHAGRDAVGVDHDRRWVDLARANLAHARRQGATGRADVIRGDARSLPALLDRELHGRVALVLASPPYGRWTHGRVSTSPTRPVRRDEMRQAGPDDLSRLAPARLADAVTTVLQACVPFLRPGGFVVLVARPWRHNGGLVDLPGLLGRAGEHAGLRPFERNVALLAGLRGETLVARPSAYQLWWTRRRRATGVPVRVIAHEDVLVLRRPA